MPYLVSGGVPLRVGARSAAAELQAATVQQLKELHTRAGGLEGRDAQAYAQGRRGGQGSKYEQRAHT